MDINLVILRLNTALIKISVIHFSITHITLYQGIHILPKPKRDLKNTASLFFIFLYALSTTSLEKLFPQLPFAGQQITTKRADCFNKPTIPVKIMPLMWLSQLEDWRDCKT